MLFLNGANTYSGGTPNGNASVNLLNNVNLDGLLTLACNAGLMLFGDISGTGSLLGGQSSVTLNGGTFSGGTAKLNLNVAGIDLAQSIQPGAALSIGGSLIKNGLGAPLLTSSSYSAPHRHPGRVPAAASPTPAPAC